MPQPSDIKRYGAYRCPDCHRTTSFLGEHPIPYEFIDIEEDEDGSTLADASNAELAATDPRGVR